ncbi:MAG: ABC transporter permease [Nitriliruptoraceae bacterium]
MMAELREQDQAVADREAEDAQPERKRWVQMLTDSTAFIFIALLGMVVAFTVLRPEAFASVNNLRNIAIAASILLVLSIGQTFVITTAGIDISVGSVLVFSGVVAALVMAEVNGGQGWAAVLVGTVAALLAGAFWGLVNGLLITKAQLPPLIVTLGTFGGVLGFAKVLTGGINLRTVPNVLIETLGIGRLFGVIPWLVILALVITTIAGITMRFTRFGRYTIAIGSSEEAARRVGINVDRHLLKVYLVSGVLAGIGGMMSLARFTNTTIQGHDTDNLQSIASVVIGGTSLFGGIATMFGTLVGVFIPTTLQNGFVILRIQPFWQEVAVGAVLIVAVYVDQLKRRARDRL